MSHIPDPVQNIIQSWGKLSSRTQSRLNAEDAWKKKAEFLDEVSRQNNVVIFVYSAYTNRYIYMSDKVSVLSGLQPSSYLAENGLEFSLSRIDPGHLNAVLLFNQLAVNTISQDKQQENKIILLCTNYLYKNGNNEYVQVLQRSSVLEVDENGRPVLFLNFIHYVGHIKKSDSVGCVISTPTNISIYSYNSNTKSLDSPKEFSTQERKIISLLAQGLDTKKIAKQLFISPHTVDNHRRNLIKKTDCIDSTGVVAFAKLINLI